MSELTKVETVGSNVVSFQDKDGQMVFRISTSLAGRRVWLGQPGVPRVELTGASALSIADALRFAAEAIISAKWNGG